MRPQTCHDQVVCRNQYLHNVLGTKPGLQFLELVEFHAFIFDVFAFCPPVENFENLRVALHVDVNTFILLQLHFFDVALEIQHPGSYHPLATVHYFFHFCIIVNVHDVHPYVIAHRVQRFVLIFLFFHGAAHQSRLISFGIPLENFDQLPFF
jgi:hypothetical protein